MMHLIPAFLILITVIIAWKKELIGVILLLALGVLHVVSNSDFPVNVYVVIDGLLLLLSGLFFISWYAGSQS